MALPLIKIQSLGAAAQTNVPFTRGQVFSPGTLPAGSGVQAGGLPLQIDVKTSWPDGSIRFAALSGVLPAMAPNELKSLPLVAVPRQIAPAAPLWPDDFSAGVIATIDGVTYRATAAPNELRKWLDGTIVTETQNMMVLAADDGTKHPHLTARFAVRNYHGTGKARVSVAIENSWAFEPNPQNFTYDMQVVIAGQTVATFSMTHFRQANWREVFWHGEAPQTNDLVENLVESKTLSNYVMLPVAESRLAQMADAVANQTKPMQLGAASPYMPTTGANDEIGLLPMWNVAYLTTMDARARDLTLQTADAAGSYPAHYRDKNTDLPVSLANFPYMTIEGRYDDTWNPYTNLKEGFPQPVAGSDSPYTPDEAHQPDLVFLAYLITCDHHYMEELQFWAMYNSFRANPNYRQFGKGLIMPGELRAQAWALRTIARAASFTPDDHPLKSDLLTLVGNNLDWYNATYAGKPGLPVMTHGFSMHSATQVAPWMADFMIQTLGHLLDLGFDEARPIFNWLAPFTVGLMVAPGTCWTLGAPYDLTVIDPKKKEIADKKLASGGGATPTQELLFDTIAECYSHDLPQVAGMQCGGPEMSAIWDAKIGDMGGISDGYMGYPSNKQPALAYAVDYGIPGAQRAWDLFMSRTVKPDYTQGGQWNIAPRDYVAKYVAPIVDPDTLLDWQQIATEGQTVTVPADTTVRFGNGDRWAKKLIAAGGPVTADRATFGDPAPGVVKTLQQLISDTVDVPPTQPPQGDKMTYKLSVVLAMAAQQLDAQSQAAPTTIRGEVLTADGQTVVASVDNGPFEFLGLAEGDYVFRASGLDSNAVVMGVPFQVAFTANDVTAPPGDPAPGGTIDVQLPSGAALTLTREQ